MSKRPGDPGYAPGWCIHYRSPSQGLRKPDLTTCEAGVEYKSVQPQTGPTFRGQPCFLTDKGESKPDALPCPKLRRPTPEEIAAHEQWFDARMNVMATVMQGIKPWRDKHRGRSHSEVVECPACKGRLHLSIAAYNGHIHGRCETAGCASWME
jgi:hypothetical protein